MKARKIQITVTVKRNVRFSFGDIIIAARAPNNAKMVSPIEFVRLLLVK